MTFSARGWPREPYFVLVNGFTNAPNVKVATNEFHAAEGWLILRLAGESRVGIDW